MTRILCMIVLLFLSTIEAAVSNSGTAVNSNSICYTKGCVKAAASILNNMDQTVDPCNDFFDFVCGNFVKRLHIPEDKSTINSITIVRDTVLDRLRTVLEEENGGTDRPTKMAKDLYSSCLNTEAIENVGLEPLLQIHNRLGGWPVVDRTWNSSSFNWYESVIASKREGFSDDHFFTFKIAENDRNTTERIIIVDQGDLGMKREFFVRGLKDKDVKAYLQFSIDVALLMGADNLTAQKEMLDVVNFQIAMANISQPLEERRNATKQYNPMTLKEFSSIFPGIDMVQYVNGLLPPSVKVNGSEIIVLSNIPYFNNLSKLLKETPKRTLANYAVWRTAQDSAEYLSEDFRKAEQKFNKAVTGKAQRSPRWKECIEDHVSKLSYIVSHLYVKNYFNEESKTRVEEIHRYVKEAYRVILQESDWMDPITKENALRKLDLMKSVIAYPPEIRQVSKLNEYYKDLQINNGSIIENMLRIKKFETDYNYKQLRETVDKSDWKRVGEAYKVNAFYSKSDNAIKMYAGILQGNFFEPDRPNYLNFGSVGMVIGHELTHGFDDQGKDFNEYGNLQNWWGNETEHKFLEKAKCLIDQYGSYVAPENGMKLNGINTQGENIADSGGLKQSYRAYQNYVKVNGEELLLPGLSEFTQNQLFWISHSQAWCSKMRPEALKIRILSWFHSPDRFRIIGPYSNSPHFARDFNCPAGSPMNPVNKCSVW